MSRPFPRRRRSLRSAIFETLENRVLLSSIVVNTLQDDTTPGNGLTSLREAIQQANADPTGDSITFAAGLQGTISLNNGVMEFGNAATPLVIDGGGLITIDAHGASGILQLDNGATGVTLRGLTFTDGSAMYGGAVADVGGNITTLSLQNCTVENSYASMSGGGVYVQFGTVNVDHCQFLNNEAQGGGGGLSSPDNAVITDSLFQNNQASSGGGARLGSEDSGWPSSISTTSFVGNRASGGGGGLDASSGATVQGVQFVSNTAHSGGGFSSNFGLTASNVQFINNTALAQPGSQLNALGGGLRFWTMGGGSVDHATFIGNRAIAATGVAGVGTTPGGYGGNAYGGAIYGGVSVSASLFAGNSATGGAGGSGGATAAGGSGGSGRGGDIYGGGNISQSTFTGSVARGGDGGAGTTAGNKGAGAGGAVFSSEDNLSISNSTFSGNGAFDGIGGSGITLGLSTVGGAIATVYPVLVATGVTISNNFSDGNGGGVYNGGTLTLIDSTISDNSLTGTGAGAGIDNVGGMQLVNDTIAGNYLAAEGGGIYNKSPATLTNCTISANTAQNDGGGIFSDSRGTLSLGNTIVAGNTCVASTAVGPDLSGTVISLGHNLIGTADGSGGWVSGDLTGTAAVPLNPGLAPLGNYGGPTQTMLPLPGSPAIDAGSNAMAVDANGNPLSTDQRGFPRVYNGVADIGADEYQALVVTLQRDPSGQEIDWSMPGASGQVPLADPNGLTLNSYGGTATIDLDFSNGNPLPTSLHLNGTFIINGLFGPISPGVRSATAADPLAGTTLDIGTSTVYLNFAGSADPLWLIQQDLKAGYNGGTWNGLSNASVGVITTSAGSSTYGIGYADSADGTGVNSTANTIELKYTVSGDTNLDGTVNLADFLAVARHFGQTAGGWTAGDFNYDGSVSLADLLLLTRHFGQSLPPTPSATDLLLPSPSGPNRLAARRR